MIDLPQAYSNAGGKRKGVFGVGRFFSRAETRESLIQRRLIPFWHIRCKSHFHYDREYESSISVSDDDVTELIIEGDEGQLLNIPKSRIGEKRNVSLRGIERCITNRDVTEFLNAYEIDESNSIGSRASSFFQDEQKFLAQYQSGRRISVDNFDAFQDEKNPLGNLLYDDGIETVTITPQQPANKVVSNVMKKVMVSKQPIRIHDWFLAVDTVDLYFRPAYVFQFERRDKDGKLISMKLEELDAVNGKWTTLSTIDVRRSSVPWDKVLLLTMDATAVVLKELGGPWTRTAAGLFEVGTKHVPGIVEDMKQPGDSEESTE